MSATKWEYKFLRIGNLTTMSYQDGRLEKEEKELNQLGMEGWELVSCVENGYNSGPFIAIFTFKRPL